MRYLLRDRDFRLLALGLTASMFGDSVLLLALGIWTKSLTGSSGLAGLAMLAIAAPALAAPILGTVIDRFRRRPFLIAVNLAAAVALCPLFLVRDRSWIWLLYTVAVLYGVSFLLLNGALAGLLKLLLPDQSLVDANGLLATARQALRLAGPLIGAGLFAAFGAVPLVVIDLASFVLAGAAVAGLRIREPRPVPGARTRTGARRRRLAYLTGGGRYLWTDPVLRRGVLAAALAILVLGAIETLSFAYVDQGLHRSPSFLGVLVAVQSVGGVLSGLLAPRIIRRAGELAGLAMGVLVLGTGFALLVHPVLWLAFVAFFVEGLGLPLLIVALNTLTQRRTPDVLIGRVVTVTAMLTDGPAALSIAASAVLVSIVDYRLLLGVMAIAFYAVAAGLWPSRRLTPPTPLTAADAGEPVALGRQVAAGRNEPAGRLESVTPACDDA
jgi:MFS family permease